MKDTTKVAALLAELKAQMTTEQEQEIVLNCEKQLKFSINEKWRDIKNMRESTKLAIWDE